MDSRIDLTENRDFRKRRENSVFGNFSFKSVHPWTHTENWCSTNADVNEITSLILTGNKEERKRKIEEFNFSYNQELNCYKCGKKIKPWNKVYSLCFSCQDEEDYLIMESNELPLTTIFKELLYNKDRKIYYFRTDSSNSMWVNSESFSL